ncbi:MAG: N-6 DNA methylase [Alphaproteobacteria bacterium]|nr:N-6 DNA methylase [Alphaproteobacteria bacterium]
MNALELEKKIKSLVDKDNHDNFIYDFLELYGTAKSTLTLLKKGNSKLSKKENQLIIKKKLFFEKAPKEDNLLSIINTLDAEPQTHTYNPRFIIVTDFNKFLAKDTKTKDTLDIVFADLWRHTDFFLPWSGKEKYQAHAENPADVKAAEKMARIYDEIYHNNKQFANEYNHDLNVFLTRLLFCFFAEDTGIFEEENLFTKSLTEHTKEDGSDLQEFFDVLFNSLDKKQEEKSSFPAYIQKFPYVNGHLFRDEIHIPELTAKVRHLMIECGDRNNWKEINPDIFGSMFQAVKTAEIRAGLGQHYTSVPNIMKVINPLFMDDLREEFEKSVDSLDKLKKLQLRLSKIRIFDPACGSGNFLIISFKQMKLLEMKIIKRINVLQKQDNLQMNLSQIELKQFYGIEIDDFACEIAKLSLWLAEHQMNCKFKDEFGVTRPTLPLRESGHIVCGNACRLNWEEVCPKYIYKNGFEEEMWRNALQNTPLRLDLPKEEAEVYILGNPPYLGSRLQAEDQKTDLKHLFKDYKSLDYISAWFIKGSKYILQTNNKLAFVSTNSINQGEQVALLWKYILIDNIEIFFAYKSFKWINNAKNNAGVTCSIISLSGKNVKNKFIFFENNKIKASKINAYLLDANDIYINRRSKPLTKYFPEMTFGSLLNDKGNLILSENEKNNLIMKYPSLIKNIRNLIGSKEFIRGEIRYCLYIKDEEYNELRKISEIDKRMNNIIIHRNSSSEKSTREMANRPNQFYFSSYKEKPSIIIPRVSSENRHYIPMGYVDQNTIISDSAQTISNAPFWILGIITSRMHMVWVRAVAGRLKTDYRYSAALCYNTFPFPNISDQQKKRIELCVNDILAIREKYSEKTMAELYDPDKMPKDLLDAHHSLDLVIEQCYKKAPFKSDEERLEYLFKMYELMVNKAPENDFKQLELL